MPVISHQAIGQQPCSRSSHRFLKHGFECDEIFILRKDRAPRVRTVQHMINPTTWSCSFWSSHHTTIPDSIQIVNKRFLTPFCASVASVAAGAAGGGGAGECAKRGSGGCGVETAGGGGELIMGIEKKAGCDERSKHWSSVCGRDSGEPAAVRRSDSASEHVSVESDGQHQQDPFSTGVKGDCCRRILPISFRQAVPVDPGLVLFCK